MPVYNTAQYLSEAVRSVSLQTFEDFELIVIDDGSTDNSLEILQELARSEPRMILFSRTNRGLIATRNELLAMASGELIAWMDSDDISVHHRFAEQLKVFDRDCSLTCLGTAALCVDPQGRRLHTESFPSAHSEIRLEHRNGGGMRFPTTMMRRSAVLEVGGFREPFRIGEDFDLFLRLGEKGKLANLDEPLYVYRHHDSSTSSKLGTKWLAYRDQILALADERRNGGTDKLQRGETVRLVFEPTLTRRQQLAGSYDGWAKAALKNGNRKLAREHAASAIRTRPLKPGYWVTMIRALV